MSSSYVKFSCVENEVITVPVDCCSGDTEDQIFSGLKISKAGKDSYVNVPVSARFKINELIIGDNSGVEFQFKKSDCIQSFEAISTLIQNCNATGGTLPALSDIETVNSVQGDGTTSDKVQLVNDILAPNPDFYYGVNRDKKGWRPFQYERILDKIKVVDSLNDTTITTETGGFTATVQNVSNVVTKLKELSFNVHGDNDLSIGNKYTVIIQVQQNTDLSFPYNNDNTDAREPIIQIRDLSIPTLSTLVVLQSNDIKISQSNGALTLEFLNLAAYSLSQIKLLW